MAQRGQLRMPEGVMTAVRRLPKPAVEEEFRRDVAALEDRAGQLAPGDRPSILVAPHLRRMTRPMARDIGVQVDHVPTLAE